MLFGVGTVYVGKRLLISELADPSCRHIYKGGIMKALLRTGFVIVVLVLLGASVGYAEPRTGAPTSLQRPELGEQAGSHLVSTTEVVAGLAAGNAQERVTGRVSFHFVTTPQDAAEARVIVRGFNLALFGVSQAPLAGRAPIQESLGMLGFSNIPGKPQTLQYDAEQGQISGELEMYADASFLNGLAEPFGDAQDGHFDTPVIPATALVLIELEDRLELSSEPQRVPGRINIRLRAEATRYEEFEFPEIMLQLLDRPDLVIDVGLVRFFEAGQRLCVQPVRLVRLRWLRRPWGFLTPLIEYSGAGLAFGEPGARAQWDKADVVFTIREWKTLFEPSYWVLDGTEAAALRALVDDDDCIEVFFVDDLDPVDMWGGGATAGSGTGSAKIISSDGNARGGVDFTHLAHELGHVLGLLHPDDEPRPSAQPASTGTLMCPSGYLNDNPQVNSQENEDLLSNPLLTYTLKFIGANPDCQDSADCGSCP